MPTMNTQSHDLFDRYSHISARLFDVPLMIHPVKLDAIIHGLSQRLGVSYPEPQAYLLSVDRKDSAPYRTERGVAMIDVFGVLAHRGGGMNPDSSSITSYESIARQLDAAINDPLIESVLLQLDSPGGEVSGAFQLAEQIYKYRSIKPIHALVDDLAASAAYLIGSAATTLTVSPAGQVGSVGVVMRHVDASQAMEKAGLKVTFIHAGSHKVDGNPYQTLPSDVKDQLQAHVDHYYTMFVNAVAKHRNIDPALVRSTEAGMFVAEEALKNGFVDAIQQPHDFIRQLIAVDASSINHLEYPMDMTELQGKVDSVTSLNADLQMKLSAMQADHAKTVEDLSAKLSAEAEQSKALFDRANALETELKSFKASVRLEAVKALFADLNKDYSEDAGLVYQGMSDESFAAVAADLRSLKPVNFSAALFQETAVKGKENATEVSLAAQLFNQVAGVK